MNNQPGDGQSGNDPAVIEEMLRTARSIAVVGMSDKTWRASHNIGRYLAENGYRVVPVNPALSEVIGLAVLSRPGCGAGGCARANGAGIDLVDVFRASEHVPAHRGRCDPVGHSLSMAAGWCDSRGGDCSRPCRRSQVRAERLHLPPAFRGWPAIIERATGSSIREIFQRPSYA